MCRQTSILLVKTKPEKYQVNHWLVLLLEQFILAQSHAKKQSKNIVSSLNWAYSLIFNCRHHLFFSLLKHTEKEAISKGAESPLAAGKQRGLPRQPPQQPLSLPSPWHIPVRLRHRWSLFLLPQNTATHLCCYCCHLGWKLMYKKKKRQHPNTFK